MKVIVTGGAGFIGSHTVELLLARGHSVLVVDDLSTGKREHVPFEAGFVGMSILASGLHRVVQDYQPNAIIHLAAQPSLRKSLEDPLQDARINIVGTLAVLAAARDCGAKLVMASTSAVYDPRGIQPYVEGDDCEPDLPYGIAKRSAELYVQSFGIPFVILRYGNVYGPRQVEVGENQLVPHCLRHLLAGAPFVINGDGESKRDFVYVGDIARANVWAVESEAQGIFNAATGESSSVNQVCQWLGGAGYFFEHGPAKEGEARNVYLDCARIHAQGWQAETNLSDGLAKTVESWRIEKVTA